MMPQARLQPSAPTTIVFTSARPDVTTLKVEVLVSTIIKPNRISDTRSIGSSRRANGFAIFCVIGQVTIPPSLLSQKGPGHWPMGQRRCEAALGFTDFRRFGPRTNRRRIEPVVCLGRKLRRGFAMSARVY